jgi:prepilin-type N-terminal cleavage/methylation domain-containing protein
VKNTAVSPMTAWRSGNREGGFSMIELVIALTIILIVSAIAVTSLKPNLQQARVDAAMREVVDTLRQAREFAIANRRFVKVSFPAGNNQIQVTQMNTLTPGAGGVNPVLTTLTLASPLVFNLDGMPDTPDGYGNANPVYIAGINGGPPTGMYFQSDGQFVVAVTYLPINGTVFMGYPGQQSTARAVTILGTTGRVRGWKSNGNTVWYQF